MGAIGAGPRRPILFYAGLTLHPTSDNFVLIAALEDDLQTELIWSPEILHPEW